MRPGQKRLLVTLTVAVAVTRILAVAESLFELDEAQFANAVSDYDVVEHRPHPPGYPMFVAAAKLLHALGLSEFGALQAVVAAGAILLFPVMALLAIELGFSFATAISAAAVLAFLPNVWVHGGTGFSDIPGLALALGACALLLRGRRQSGAFVGGAALLGIAVGVRTSTLLVAAVPAVAGGYARLRAGDARAVAGAFALAALLVGAAYIGAALASESSSAYVEAVQAQQAYVGRVDSFRNPDRPTLLEAGRRFFVAPFNQRQQMLIMLALMAISIAVGASRRATPALLTAAMFLPVATFSWLELDLGAASRYAIAYMPAYALLTADGLRVMLKRERVCAASAALLVLALAMWTWPAIRLQATSQSPPAAAFRHVRDQAPSGSTVYVHVELGPHALHLLPDYRRPGFESRDDIPLADANAMFVDVGVLAEAQQFSWPRDRLWRVLRQRNFDVSVGRVADLVRYGDGWHDAEPDGQSTFRWMSGREATVLLPVRRPRGRLTLKMDVPLDTLAAPPTVTLRFNGTPVATIVADEKTIEQSWLLPSRIDGVNELRISTSATFRPSDIGLPDTRELGLRVRTLQWSAVEASATVR